jgi:hypothetical protein
MFDVTVRMNASRPSLVDARLIFESLLFERQAQEWHANRLTPLSSWRFFPTAGGKA